MLTKNKRIALIMLSVTLLLCLPLVAMQFSTGVNWSPFDFLIAGILLFGTGILCEIMMRKIKNIKYRIIICATILLGLFLVWAELAVGIFGTPLAGS